MIKLSFHAAFGVVLCGCTVNNFHEGAFAEHHSQTEIAILQYSPTKINSTVEHAGSSETADLDKSIDEQILRTPEATGGTIPLPSPLVGNMRLKPECMPYVPLPVPKPVQIDFAELEAATTSKEINAIALRNVRQLHTQIKEFSAKQQRHYAEYSARCIVK